MAMEKIKYMLTFYLGYFNRETISEKVNMIKPSSTNDLI